MTSPIPLRPPPLPETVAEDPAERLARIQRETDALVGEYVGDLRANLDRVVRMIASTVGFPESKALLPGVREELWRLGDHIERRLASIDAIVARRGE